MRQAIEAVLTLLGAICWFIAFVSGLWVVAALVTRDFKSIDGPAVLLVLSLAIAVLIELYARSRRAHAAKTVEPAPPPAVDAAEEAAPVRSRPSLVWNGALLLIFGSSALRGLYNLITEPLSRTAVELFVLVISVIIAGSAAVTLFARR